MSLQIEVDMISVYFYTKDYNESLCDIQTYSFNHKVGDVIHISQEGNTKHWDIEEFSGLYEIIDIKPHYRKHYPRTDNVQSVRSIIIFDVFVKEVEK